MKLSEYAKQKSVTYRTAWNWWNNGYLEGEQLPSGTILVYGEDSSQQDQGLIQVFTCGCFDLLHIGQISYLQTSRSLGDSLTVLLNTDKWIEENKRTPIYCQEYRKKMLEALSCVDEVVLFDTNEQKDEILRGRKPYYFTKATKFGEYCDPNKLLETKTLEEWGGVVIIIQSEYPECSTTNTINKIIQFSSH